MGRDRNRKGHDNTRDSGPFVALPWSVLDSPAYIGLSHPAKALLMEIARQYVRDNNGRLLASRAYLAGRGWKSHDTISRALSELIAAGLIHQTVMGHRPNKASWYAVTWRTLDRIPGYDAGAAETFQRSAYTKQSLKNESLSPSPGQKRPAIGLSPGQKNVNLGLSPGPINDASDSSSSPSHGHHLDTPSNELAIKAGIRHETTRNPTKSVTTCNNCHRTSSNFDSRN
jgi:hypothetical protein